MLDSRDQFCMRFCSTASQLASWSQALADALTQNTVLRKLSLIGNQVGEEATQARGIKLK